MGEVQRYQRCLRCKGTVREDRFGSFGIALLDGQTLYRSQRPRVALT